MHKTFKNTIAQKFSFFRIVFFGIVANFTLPKISTKSLNLIVEQKCRAKHTSPTFKERNNTHTHAYFMPATHTHKHTEDFQANPDEIKIKDSNKIFVPF
jgi:hypothetical protein